MARLHVYAEIACRYGVNPLDRLAVQDFFQALWKLTPEERAAIDRELVARGGEAGNKIDEILEGQASTRPLPPAEVVLPGCRN